MKRTTSISLGLAGILLVLSFASCRTTMGVLGDRNAKLRTGQWWATPVMTLKPIRPDQRKIWFRYRDLTQESYDLSARIRQGLEGAGYQLVNDPDQARFHCYYTLRFFGENDKADGGKATATALGAIAGGAAGVGIAAAAGGGTAAYVAGGLGGGVVGGLTGLAIHNYSKAVEYNMILDMRIAERKKGPVLVSTEIDDQQVQHSGAGANTAGGVIAGMQSTFESNKQSHQETTNMLWRENRLVLFARQIGLEPQEAQPKLENALVKMLPQVLP